jgi:MFS family permease
MVLSRPNIVYFTSFATDYAYFAFLFVITRLLAETGSSQWHLGVFGACTSICYALSGPLAGALSDRIGRRRVILSGAAGAIAVLLICSTWRSRPLFYVAGAFFGVAAALIYPPLIAWLTEDGRDTSRRLFGFCIAWNTGVIVAQVSGGWLYAVRPQLPLLVAAVPMVGVLALMLTGRPAAPSGPSAAPAAGPPTATHDSPSSARVFVYLAWLSNLAGAFSFSLLVHLFPYLAHESGISPPVHGVMLALNRMGVIGTYVLMYRFTFWRYRLWTAVASQLLAMAGLALLGFAGSVPVLTLGLVLTALMLGYNYFASIYYSTVAFGTERKGAASGMHEASLAMGSGLGALGGGLLGALYGARAPYRFCVILLGVFMALQWAIWRCRRDTPRR